MLKIDPAVTTIVSAGVIAIAVGIGAGTWSSQSAQRSLISSSAHAQSTSAAHQWAASATGRVEPKYGEVRIASQTAGKIVEVLADTNDKVEAGDLLVRLDDAEIYAKLAAAAAEVGVRTREREEEPATGLALEREKATDAVADGERKVFAAREAFDAALRARKIAGSDDKDAAAKVEDARKVVEDAKTALTDARAKLAEVAAKPDMPLETRLESSLALARSDLSSAEIAIERTRIRAPSSGTVLNMLAKPGETAVPSPDSALVVFGDLSSLRLRAEVEERDAAKVRVGQKVVVKADAFPDREFTGTVTSISQSLGAPRIATRGPRRPNDVEVVEVMVDLDGHPPLFTGMRVDVFFKLDSSADASGASKTD